MNFDRSFAGAQFISDLLIKQTGNNQLQHFVLAVDQQVISPAQLGNFSSLLAARAVALLRPNRHQRLFERIVSTGASGSFLSPDHRSSDREQRSAQPPYRLTIRTGWKL